MDDADDKKENPEPTSRREIFNADMFADDIVFSDTEKILFEEDLQETAPVDHAGMMEGNPEKRYSANKKLNEGGMKAIWEVDDHRTARKVAMALIQDSKIASEQDIESFLYEARLTANLQHPNIIPIYDIALDENGNPYFTMKSLKGETLGDILKKLRQGNAGYRKQYTFTTLLSIFAKVCNAISYAHSKGVIHLDLKPSNVIVGDYGDVHVLDWGLSTLITHLTEYEGEPISWHSIDEVSLEDGQTLTRYLESSAKSRERRNVVGGTPGYMSPEQAQGSPANIDFQTDVYMLGALLYEMLTHHCPITGETVKDVLQKTVRGEVPAPGTRAPELRIPAALASIAMKALETDPANRYPTVTALLEDVRKYQDGFATSAENPTFITHLALLVKRHKMAVSLIAVCGLLVTAILANSFNRIRKSERVAVEAKDLATERLVELQLKQAYIESTAKKVAPDYLNLMAREEKDYAFSAAESALATSLAFDPSQETGWMWKGKMLLCQQEFSKALEILAGRHGHPVRTDTAALALAEKYQSRSSVPDSGIPDLVRDFINYNLGGGIPRLFYHLNRAPFDPATRFPALEESLKRLNPKVEKLHFSWKAAAGGGWKIDLSGNPDLDDISPLCGLRISQLNASDIGAPDLKLLTEDGMKELQLADTGLNHLFELDQFAGLQGLDISGTHIRNLINIVKYPLLTSLDISNIEGLSISPQLVWCRNLRTLTVSEEFKTNPTIRTLANRGVIIIYTAP
jgi:serine/threonine protein kinase